MASAPAHLPPPPRSCPSPAPAIPGEGQWSPVGRLVGGIPAVYETTLRPDAVHTSYVVGVAWMDTKLLKATLYSGSQIPGGGPYSHTAPVRPARRDSLVAAFNAGFLMSAPTAATTPTARRFSPFGRARRPSSSTSNGTATVGQWGRT